MTSSPSARTTLGRLSWCLFDWANSSFPTVITTFIFAAYFTQSVAPDPETGTAWWSRAIGIAALLVAVGSPLLGAVADQRGRRKPWVFFFSLVCVVATGLLWFIPPGTSQVVLALGLVVIASAAFDFSGVFYNAMLPGLAPADHWGRLSGWGWGLGYAGGLLCLLLVLMGFIQTDTPWLPVDRGQLEHVRIAAPIAALWFTLFALPLFLFTPDQPATGVAMTTAMKNGTATFLDTLRHLPRHGDVLRFLIARLFYNEGLNTLFAFGGIYAAGSFGMTMDEVIRFGLALNITAGIGAALFAWIDDRLGAKPTILISLVALFFLALALLLITDKGWFWVLGLGLGIFVGPAQASSRTLMARLAPPGMENEMFGLFALSGKATAFLGPFLLGWLTLAFQSQRAGMAVILVLFALGFVILIRVKGGDKPATSPLASAGQDKLN